MGLQEELNELKLQDEMMELDAFIREQAGDPRLTDGAEMRLLPFFLIASAGQFDLKPASELNANEVAATLTEAFDFPPRKIRFLSLTEQLARIRDCIGDRPQDRIGVGLGISTLVALISEHGDEFYYLDPGNKWTPDHGQPPKFCTALHEKMNKCLLGHLLPVLNTQLSPLLDVQTGRDIPGIYRNALTYYLGFTLAGDNPKHAERAARLRRFITLLTCAVPLGEDRDEPGTWIILTA